MTLKPTKKKAAIARECGVDPQTINNWLNTGKVSRENSVPLAKSLKCSTDWLLAGVGPRERSHGPVDRPRLSAVLNMLFSAAQNAELDIGHIPPGHAANIVAIAYDLIGETNQNAGEAMRIVRRVIESMLQQGGSPIGQTRGIKE